MSNPYTQARTSLPFYPILVISLCAGFQFYKYVLQVYPSIITDQLMREFHLSGAGLGNLAGTFYYTFMVTQLFVGILLDKFSTRWVTAMAIFCCAAGVFCFSQTQSVLSACLCRALIGIGVAFSTVAYMKIASVWFHPKHYAFIGGLIATATMAGAVFGEVPLATFIEIAGWRQSLLVLGIAGFILTALFIWFVRDEPFYQTSWAHDTTSSNVTRKELVKVIKSKQNWLLTLYAGLAFAPISVFAGLWGNPFLQQAYQIDKTQAALMTSFVFIGLGIGSPIIGVISGRLGERRKVMMCSTVIACLALTAVLYAHPMSLWLLKVLLFIFGFALGAFLLSFSVGKEINDPRITATVIAMINAGDAILTGITEPAIGKLLDLGWTGHIVDGVRYFSLQSYHWALSVLPLFLIISVIILFWVKDKPAELDANQGRVLY